MKNDFISVIARFVVICIFIASSACEKDKLPQVTTVSVTEITAVSAKCGGNVTDPGAKKVISRGVVWSTTSNPSIEDHDGIVLSGFGGGVFACQLTYLYPNTKYYVRAFATNAEGTSYGDNIQFTTLNGTSNPVLPSVVTSGVTNITLTGATCGGDVTNSGGDTVTARGVCWSVNQNPTIANSKTTDGNGTGLFVSILSNLQSNTTYYVRAYASNTVGTAYGNEVMFVTNNSGLSSPSVATSQVTSITLSSAVCGGNVISDGGASVTQRGVCWDTLINPTTSNSHTIDGSGLGVFVSNVTGLLPGKTYHIRAYATNSQGTSYGLDNLFTTLTSTVTPPTVSTSSISNLTNTTANAGGDVTADGGSAVLSKGVCWSTSPNPTISNDKTVDGSGLGSFVSSLTALIPGTTYYLRAYAANTAGTGYGNEIQFTTLSILTYPVYDIDGNGYDTVHIVAQIWLKQNLRTTKYNDGTTIPQYTTNSTWGSLTTGGMCWYNNDSATYAATYGALYNWYATNSSTNGGKNMCPIGWHVPFQNDWNDLINYFGGSSTAGGSLKMTGTIFWTAPNTGATNASSFSAIASGSRDAFNGTYSEMGNNAYFWSTTAFNSSNSYGLKLFYNNILANLTYNNKEYGWAVRCIKD